MAQWLRNQRRKCTQCQVQHQKQHPILEVEINTNVRAIIEFMAKSEQHYTKVWIRTQVQTGLETQEFQGLVRSLPLGHQQYITQAKIVPVTLKNDSPTQQFHRRWDLNIKCIE